MKKIYDIVSMAILLFCTAACSDSYLELSPESSVSDEVIFENADAAQYAVNGLGRIMSTQYLDTQGYNGEGTVYAYQGEYPGDVIQKGSYTGWQNLAKGNYFTSSTNSNIHVTWYYYYKLIRNANQILDNCKTGLANVAEQRKWDYIKAQALVYRAYSYTMLSQLYSRRWTDADGLQRGLVLRTTVNNDEMPCSTMAETFELIYHDLDEAISLFTSCGYDRPVDVDKRWMANLDVAHAVYSRAALIRNDWQTVITHSQEARRNYSIMTPDEYKAGFNTANQEWIWEVFEDDTQPVHYYSFYNYMSASCLGSASRTYPPCISKQIVDPIDPADKRLTIYAIPTPEEVGDVSKVSGSGKVTKGDFYNRVKKEFAGRIYSTTTIFYYLSTKFIVKSGTGDGCIPIFRAAEMMYNEAEAQYRLGNEQAVRALLEQTVKPYNADYTCTKSGDSLWEELKAYRKFDLCNEGHSWFDLKRWGDPMVRKTWAEGGSWATYFAEKNTTTGGNYGPADKNAWTAVIPTMETNYNSLVSNVEKIKSDGTWDRN